MSINDKMRFYTPRCKKTTVEHYLLQFKKKDKKDYEGLAYV